MDGESGRIAAPLVGAIGQSLAEINDEWRAKVDQLNKRIAELEHVANLHARFSDLERNLAATGATGRKVMYIANAHTLRFASRLIANTLLIRSVSMRFLPPEET
jgi:hypothetical protein